MNQNQVLMVTDNTAARQLAIFYGVFDAISKKLLQKRKDNFAIATGKHENVFYAVSGFSNFENEADNGWICLLSENESAVTYLHNQCMNAMGLERITCEKIASHANN